jgi:hypothetical protein
LNGVHAENGGDGVPPLERVHVVVVERKKWDEDDD